MPIDPNEVQWDAGPPADEVKWDKPAPRARGGLNPDRAKLYANESVGDSLKRQAGELLPSGEDLSAAVKGVTSLPHMLMDPITGLARSAGVPAKYTPSTASEESAYLDKSLGAPTTPAGRIKADVIQSVAGVPAFTVGGPAIAAAKGAPEWLKAAGTALAADPMKQAASAALAGAGAGGAREAGAGPGIQTAAGLASGSLPFVPELTRALTSNRPIQRLVEEISSRTKEPTDFAVAKVAQYMARRGYTIDKLAEKLKASPGHVLGDLFPQELRDVVSMPGKSRGMAEEAVKGRRVDTRQLVQETMKDALGVDTANVYGEHQGLNAQMRDIAKTRGYDRILNEGHVELTPKLQKMLEMDDYLRAGLPYARKNVRHDIVHEPGVDSQWEQFFKETPAGVEFMPYAEHPTMRPIVDTPAGGPRPLNEVPNPRAPQLPGPGRTGTEMERSPYAPDPELFNQNPKLRPAPVLNNPDEIVGEVAKRPTLRAWDYVKRGLQDYIESQRGDFGKLSPDGRKAQKSLNELMVEMRKNPEYAALLDEYTGPKRGQELLKAGRTFLKRDAEEIADEMAGMTAAEKRYYRIGVTRDLMEENPLQAYRNLNQTGGMFNQAYADKVRSVFEPGPQGQAEYDKMVDALRIKAEQQHMENVALPAYSTGSTLEGQKDTERGANLVTSGTLTGSVDRIIRGLQIMFDSEKSELRRNEIGRILTMAQGNDLDKVVRAAEKLMNRGPMSTRVPVPPSGAKPALINAGVESGRQ